jgi:hypothetical protein
MLSGMRAIYDVRIPKVRKSLATVAKYVQHRHPLVEQALQTRMAASHEGGKVSLRFPTNS